MFSRIFKLILIFCFILIPFTFNGRILVWAQDVDISNIEIYDFKDGTGRIKWTTLNQPTRGIVYYGLNRDNLNKWMGYSLYTTQHETVLTGLEKDKTYYFKILSFDQSQQQTESFIQSFSTKNMIDTINPKIEKAEVLQTTNNALALRWVTDELTKATVYYGIDTADTISNPIKYKTASYKSYHQIHEMFIYKLEINKQYRVKIEAIDKGGNKAIYVLRCQTQISTTDYSVLQIKDIEPLDPDGTKISDTQAIIDWRTNLIAKSIIYYGVKSKKYDNKIDVVKDQRQLYHKIILTGLKPNTQYYYKIKAYDSLYGKSIETGELSFTTKPVSPDSINVIQPVSEINDTDRDGLIDSYEIQIGTDPNRADTDNDSYADGYEVAHGYNPLGSGKLAVETYLKPRFAAAIEKEKTDKFKTSLEERLSKLNLNDKNWQILINAYLYGDYPSAAVVKAVQYGGRTVHPTISWQSWQNSSDYKSIMGQDPEKELKSLVESALGKLNVSSKNWQTLVNAYTQQNYPARAIIQAIRLGGRTVHPTIPWDDWKKSYEYKKYINQ